VIHRGNKVGKKAIGGVAGACRGEGYADRPLMLLTTIEAEDLLIILEIYLTRCKCEESHRFIKQGYNLEDVRVMSYAALRNTLALVQAVLYIKNSGESSEWETSKREDGL
jgi:hypothetical protein